ncbi:hypothetical protein B484DRAFT_398024 [Ochromonadaceae sp. CCMP2298]|nr:hypothetical protein B484DRAFT_398024 [Ochromonadaceae sp. CCMP2298]
MENVTAFERTLDLLIKAEGCVVPDEFLRTDRRARRSDDKGDCEALRMLTTSGALTDMELLANELGVLMDADDEEDAVERALREADEQEDGDAGEEEAD